MCVIGIGEFDDGVDEAAFGCDERLTGGAMAWAAGQAFCSVKELFDQLEGVIACDHGSTTTPAPSLRKTTSIGSVTVWKLSEDQISIVLPE